VGGYIIHAKLSILRTHGLIWEKWRDLGEFFDSLQRGQLCVVLLHKIIQPVTDFNPLLVFMWTYKATDRLINFPLFDIDNIAQGLQTPGAAAITDSNDLKNA
jgi:hypothetical protein